MRVFTLARSLALSTHRRSFTVLAFESSADDSCAAIVDHDRNILANVVIKQDKLNESFGGIHPYVAIDQHQANLPIALRRALDNAKMRVQDVDGIAFTRGPGMGGCLSVSMNAAKGLAAALDKPIVGVHHMQAHALTPFLTLPAEQVPKFPFLTLLVSGGHTMILLARSRTKFLTLATTLDESVGTALDKGARALGLPPSGAALEQFAVQPTSDPEPLGLPPVPHQLAFSYCGPRSLLDKRVHALDMKYGGRDQSWTPLPNFPGAAVLSEGAPLPKEVAPISEEHRRALRELAWVFQSACFAQIEEKVRLALKLCNPVTGLVVSGGVASNMLLRERLQAALQEDGGGIPLLCPPPHLCTDNAAMIAWASMHRFLAGHHDRFDLKLAPKWALETLEDEPGAFIDSQ
ncbi:peptidase M22, glycoprotease [Exidia glandulosa HHB12029]|uniref:N(6)-L-threonylcarbamoyladenine synthase n=1 Tax=Exidia glandulosa HHB12029 TaxID=1314781 RepID=A0A165JPA1_EXIGL|nr:peptidase M22, glycoprotease [Exidia glandulosa HHB12029]